MRQMGPVGFFACVAAVHTAIGVFALYRMTRRPPRPLEEQSDSVPVTSTVATPTATLPVEALRDQMDRGLAAMAAPRRPREPFCRTTLMHHRALQSRQNYRN